MTDNIRRLQQKLTEADSLAAEQNRQIIARDSVLSKSDQEHTAIKIKIEYIQRQLDEANERQRNREEEISQLKKDAKERERAHKAAIDQLKSEANTVAQRNMRDAQEREKALRAELKTVLEENSQIRARLEAIGNSIKVTLNSNV